MNTEKVVLEWCTEWRDAGVLESWPAQTVKDAGPEAGIPTEATMDIENWVLEGGWRRVLAENGCAQLHVFTRNYTHLHNVSGGNVMSDKTQKKWARIAGLGMTKSRFWIQGAAFCRLLPPSAAFSHGGQMAKWESGGKDRLAGAYFRFGKWGNKLLN